MEVTRIDIVEIQIALKKKLGKVFLFTWPLKDYAFVATLLLFVKDKLVWSTVQSSNELLYLPSMDSQISLKICKLQSLEEHWMIQA